MINAGEYVTCPVCGKELLRFKRSLKSGDIIQADLFETMGAVPQPVDGEEVLTHCGVQPIQNILPINSLVGLKIHTKNGWRFK